MPEISPLEEAEALDGLEDLDRFAALEEVEAVGDDPLVVELPEKARNADTIPDTGDIELVGDDGDAVADPIIEHQLEPLGDLIEVEPLAEDEVVIEYAGGFGFEKLEEVEPLAVEAIPIEEPEEALPQVERLPDIDVEDLELLQSAPDPADSDPPGELSDTVALEPGTFTVPFVGFPGGEMPAVMAESVESMSGDIDLEFADLEEVVGAGHIVIHMPSEEEGNEFAARLDKLVAEGSIKILSVEDLTAAFDTASSAVDYDGTSYSVGQDLLESATRSIPPDEELKDLIDSVVSTDSDEGSSGIDDILGDTVLDIDMPLDDLVPADIEADATPPRAGRLIYSANGLDYDRFVSSFQGADRGVLKSLMRVSQRAHAMTAALLCPEGDCLAVYHSIGLNDTDSQGFRICQDEQIFEHIFGRRFGLYVFRKDSGLEEIDSKIGDQDRRYIGASIYLPVILDGRGAYLYLGLRDASDSLDEVLQRINGVTAD